MWKLKEIQALQILDHIKSLLTEKAIFQGEPPITLLRLCKAMPSSIPGVLAICKYSSALLFNYTNLSCELLFNLPSLLLLPWRKRNFIPGASEKKEQDKSYMYVAHYSKSFPLMFTIKFGKETIHILKKYLPIAGTMFTKNTGQWNLHCILIFTVILLLYVLYFVLYTKMKWK